MKYALITGANRGIGLALTQQLTEKGVHVFALCRHASVELKALSHITIIDGVDLKDKGAIESAKDKITHPLDLMINNAGILSRVALPVLDDRSMESILEQFKINALGPLLLTSIYSPLLKKGSKVALITSRMGSIADNGSGSHYGYRMSKAALNAAGKSLAIDLKPKGISVAILHPGWIQTDMTGHTGNDNPQTSAQQLLERIDDLCLDNTGTFWHANGEILPW
tara:strand:+ start:462 stop:1133 length:672 start_codon:yes stop_codon:yes gene_type:complete